MSQVMYRKYRSQEFDDLIGQGHVVNLLKNAVAQDQVSHAYLFYGSRGLGKTSTARILAKAVNCLQLKPDGNPCGVCTSCTAIREGRFLDLIEIDAASNRGIDQIRELKEKIEFSPSEGKKKVYIIDEVHMLTTEAFNALLKTLEEPPAHAIFILATTEIHKVPATILSRCQRFDFRPATDGDVLLLLNRVLKEEGVTADDTALSLLVENARGSYRDALSLLDVVVSGQKEDKTPKHISEEEVRMVLGLADSTMVYFLLEKIVNGNAAEALDLVSELAEKGVNLGQFVKYTLKVLRDILISGMRGEAGKEEYSFAVHLDRQKTLKLINLFVDAERSLKDALVPTLPLELLIADAMELFEKKPVPDVEVVSSLTGGGGDTRPSGKEPKKKTKIGRKITMGAASNIIKRKPCGVNADDALRPSEKQVDPDEKQSVLTDLTKDQVEKRWGEFLRALRPFNSHLYAFIGRSRLKDVKDGELTLSVAFDFHKDRIEMPKSRVALSEAFKSVFGQPVRVCCELDDSIRPSAPAAEVVVIEEPESYARSSGSKASIYDSVSEVFGDELVAV